MNQSLPPLPREEYRSPLWLITQDPLLTSFVSALQDQRRAIMEEPEREHVLHFSGDQLDDVRESFAATIRRGESRLHRLCGLLCHLYFNQYEIGSVVIGEVAANSERFTLVQRITQEELFTLTDLDLGNRQLSKLRFLDDGQWRQPNLVANLVEYQPLELDARGIHRITSRIKAEEEIWNKVVDEIFEMDELVQRDKQLAHLSRYVKDIFGLKVVTTESGKVRRFHEDLGRVEFSAEQLAALEVPFQDNTRRLEFVEVKDYLDRGEAKRSGWKAIKSVISWWGDTFEIQVQPLRNYLQERERLTRESHASFKTRREQLRGEISKLLPLYGFYRDLLRWLFLRPDEAPPTYPNVKVQIDERILSRASR